MQLAFDPLFHVYSVDGQPKPSVTEINRANGLTGSFEFRDRIHSFRGTAVHQGSAIIIDGTEEPYLDPLEHPHNVDPHYIQVHSEIPNYWEAIRDAKAAIKFTGCIYECSFLDPGRGFGGTLDFAAFTAARNQLWDIKSGTYPEMTIMQICAYEDLARRGQPVDPAHAGLDWLRAVVNCGEEIERAGLRLEKTGRFTAFYETSKGEPYSLPKWMFAWRSALFLFTKVPGHQYVESTLDGTPIKRSHLSDINWVAQQIRSELKGQDFEVGMRAAENLYNLRQQYGLL